MRCRQGFYPGDLSVLSGIIRTATTCECQGFHRCLAWEQSRAFIYFNQRLLEMSEMKDVPLILNLVQSTVYSVHYNQDPQCRMAF